VIEPDGNFCDPFDGLAARVRFADLRTIGFTSSVFGEGTSTIALGTALSLASLGPAPVLLVDANWLQPSLTSDAGASSGRGLAEVLRGDVELSEVVVPTGRSRLAFLAAGDTTEGKPPLGALPSLLDRALSCFGSIVVDLPPALVGESMVLPWAASLQQLFVVVRSGMTPLALARRAVEEIAVERPQVVLNWVPASNARKSAIPRGAVT
jgi:Mrp family chromosome partitioning ATPase